MKRSFSLLCVLLVAAASFAGASDRRHYHRHGGHNFNITSSNSASDACEDQLQMSSDDFSQEARAEEQKVVANQPLKITAARNGGISVRQWDRNEIGIKACKAVLAKDSTSAQRMLDQIKLAVSGNNVTIDGPDSYDDNGRWSAVMVVHVPKNAQLDLTGENGGIAFTNVQVNAIARTHNGGISLKQASGKLDISADNGGVSVQDCNGDIKVNVRNGGVALKLGDTWSGAGLEARTHNGGLSVEVPSSFKSSLEVEGSRHATILCKGSVCRTGDRTWDDDGGRILRIGSGNPVIRTSTVNGGVVIKNRDAGDDDDSI